MLYWYKHTPGGIVLRCLIRNATTPKDGLTGLSSASSGLIIGTIADVESTSTNYTVAASNVETITTLGTFQAPSSGKCRLREVDPTNHPGTYEIHLATARLAVANATYLNVTLSGATNMSVTAFVIRLSLLDPQTVMRGTDSAYTGTPPTAAATATAVRSELATELDHIDADISSRMASGSEVVLTAAYDAAKTAATQTSVDTIDANVDTLLVRVTTTVVTLWANLTAMITGSGASAKYTTGALSNAPSGGGGGSATLEKQEEILAAIQGAEVIQVASPNVSGNLVLTQGDTYDGIANPKAQWTVTTDYTDGWTVTLTIRDTDDAVVYTTEGEVSSSTVIVVEIDAPTGLAMTGCPGQWQGKFDVQLVKAGSTKTIALGVCYINEDQTR